MDKRKIFAYTNLVCCGNCTFSGWICYSNICEFDREDKEIENNCFCDKFKGIYETIEYIKPKELTYE